MKYPCASDSRLASRMLLYDIKYSSASIGISERRIDFTNMICHNFNDHKLRYVADLYFINIRQALLRRLLEE